MLANDLGKDGWMLWRIFCDQENVFVLETIQKTLLSESQTHKSTRFVCFFFHSSVFVTLGVFRLPCSLLYACASTIAATIVTTIQIVERNSNFNADEAIDSIELEVLTGFQKLCFASVVFRDVPF